VEAGNFNGSAAGSEAFNGSGQDVPSCNCILKKLKEAGASFYLKNIHGKMVITMDKVNKCLLNDLV
jgi:hypothetical protein